MNTSRLRRAYMSQKAGAKQREIAWLFTFDTWLDVWESSGRIHERGPGRNQFCMARTNDAGPYSPDNVRITTNEDNWKEAAEVTSARAAFAPHDEGAGFSRPSLTQLSVLRFLVDHAKTKGFPPTNAEISAFFGWRSANAALEHIRALEKKNLISRDAHKSRSIRVTAHGDNAVNQPAATAAHPGEPIS